MNTHDAIIMTTILATVGVLAIALAMSYGAPAALPSALATGTPQTTNPSSTRLLVQLTAPPLASVAPNPLAQFWGRLYLTMQQQHLTRTLTTDPINGIVVRQVSYTVNMLIVDVPTEHVATVRQLTGVRSVSVDRAVGREPIYTPTAATR